MKSAAMRRAVFLAVLVAAALLAESALAARRPTGAERRAIISAIHQSPLTHDVPPDDYRVAWIHVVTAVRGWAEALLVGRGPEAKRVQTLGALLQRRHGHWRVTVVGAIGLGCRAPWAVRRDLGLIC
jgi:hypothetical protein